MAKQSLDELIEQSEETIAKGGDLSEIEAEHHGKEKEKQHAPKEKVEDKIKAAKFEEEEDKQEKPEEETKEEPAKIKKVKKGKAKIRSKKYRDAKALFDPRKKYALEEALDLVKKTSLSKFDGKVELHARVLGKSGKPEILRGLITYPHATGKKIKVVILDDKTIEEIAASAKADFDVALSTPAQMPKVAKLAKILGPKGKMPNPKSGTVTADPEKTKKELASGATEYRTDSYGNIHQIIGKVSFDEKALKENAETILNVLPKEKITSVTLCATMGPGIKILTK